MSTASFTSAMGGPENRGGRTDDRSAEPGATALLSGRDHPRHLLGNALRVTKVFLTTAFGVVVLGQSDQDAGVYRRKSARPARVVPQPRPPSAPTGG
ncbi:hypothetical protein MTQ01_04755 [Streptomyces sp. XM4193]|uniref:hypothetical protein n=1 Tax=Streptomyces sp. XM4193 TaxID=2929782 RepID=UPI001FFB9ED4|nr:hypothetical protein [Streptomyces sp. XM4193]MCK1795329.1 hypothetical protein [Streptomyces sp. XM4193]